MLNRFIAYAAHFVADPIRFRCIVFVGLLVLSVFSLLATGTLAFADGGGGGTHWCNKPGC